MFKKTLLALTVTAVSSSAFAGGIYSSVTEATPASLFGAGVGTGFGTDTAALGGDDDCLLAAAALGVTADLNGFTNANPGAADGSYSVVATGGTSPYNVAYPGNPLAAAAGTYSVVVTDAEGCTFNIDVTVGESCPDNEVDFAMFDS